MRFFHKPQVDALAIEVNCVDSVANQLREPSRSEFTGLYNSQWHLLMAASTAIIAPAVILFLSKPDMEGKRFPLPNSYILSTPYTAGICHS
jgi:hypothetical protein